MFANATQKGYGYFFHNGFLFFVHGLFCSTIFQMTTEKLLFPFFIDEYAEFDLFDPPRWLYIFDNKLFYKYHSSPCGG